MKSIKEKTSDIQTTNFIGFTKNEKLGIISMLFIIVVSPIVFSQFSSYFSFNDTGEIGDTIGGITAPFVNLLAAYLVYKSFHAQISANQQQRKDHGEQIKEIRKDYQFNYIKDLYSLISNDYYSNSKDPDKESWVSSLITLAESYNDPNMWVNHNQLGIFVSRKSNDEIIESINDLSLTKLDVINRQVNNIKIFAKEIKNVQIEYGLIEFYTFKIEEIIKDSDIWMLLDEHIQRLLNKPNFFYEYQKYEIEFITKTVKEIKDMDFIINPY